MLDFRRIGTRCFADTARVALVTAIAIQLTPHRVNSQAAAAIVPVGAAIVILGGIAYYTWINSQGQEELVPTSSAILKDPEEEIERMEQCLPNDLDRGDCWIGLSLADSSGLILAARVGKHTDELIAQLVVSTEGKTACKQWNSEDWGGYERVLPPEILPYIGKDKI